MIPTIMHHYGTEVVLRPIDGDVENNNTRIGGFGFLSLNSSTKVATSTMLVVSGIGLVGLLVFLFCHFTNSTDNIVVMGGVALLVCIIIVICYTKPISMLTSFE
ncbi:hypothetical protein Pcinc_028771, partial [Petrolisthes cinctipes]